MQEDNNVFETSIDSGISIDIGSPKPEEEKSATQSKMTRFQEILFILERDKLLRAEQRKRLSQLAERRQRKKRAEDPCNVCCKDLDLDNIRSSIKCVNCQKPACRGQSCSVWIPSRSGWECHLCNQSHESISKSSEWLNQQVAGRYLSPLSARSEPALLRDHLSPIEPDRRSEATSSFHGDQRERVREMIEETLSEMLGGSLDNISVNQLYKSRKYLELFCKYHSLLSHKLHRVERSWLLSQSVTDLPTWENGEEPGMSHIKLKRLIEKIINDTLRLPNFTNEPLTPGPTSDQTLPFFDPKKYQELLATAVLNKIVDSYNYEQKFDSNRDAATDCSDLDRNHNALISRKLQSGSISSSSIEPESDCSITDPLTNVSRLGDFSRSDSGSNLYTDTFNRNEQRDSSMLTDYLAKHNVPLPDFSIDTDSSNEDNLSESKNLDDSWEGNWLFKKKRMRQDASCPVGMLVPCPKEDIKTQIGDKTADELSDLSEAGSDCEDNNNIDEIEDMPPNALIQNRNIIGGKSPLGFFDELLEQTSLVSVSSVAEGDAVFTETKNDYVLGDDLERDLADFHAKEAINSYVDTQKIQNKLSDSKNPEKQVPTPNPGKKPEAKPRSIQKPPVYVNVKEIPESELTSSSAASSATITEIASESLTNDPTTSINNTNNNNPEEDAISRSNLPENLLKKIQCSKASAIQFLAVVALAPSTAIPIVDTIHFDSIVQTTEKFAQQVEAETEDTEIDPEANLVDVGTITPPEYMKEMQNSEGQDVFIPPPYEFSSESEVSSECETSINISRVVKIEGSTFAGDRSEVSECKKQGLETPEDDFVILEAQPETTQSVEIFGTTINAIESENTGGIEGINVRDTEKSVESKQSKSVFESAKERNSEISEALCENRVPTESLQPLSMNLTAELNMPSQLVVDDDSKERRVDNSTAAEVEQSSDACQNNASVGESLDSNEATIQIVGAKDIPSDDKHSGMSDIKEELPTVMNNNDTQKPAEEIKTFETRGFCAQDVNLCQNISNEVSVNKEVDAKQKISLDFVEKHSNDNQHFSKDISDNQTSSKTDDGSQDTVDEDLKVAISTIESNLIIGDANEYSGESIPKLNENVNPDSDSCKAASRNTTVEAAVEDNATVGCEDAPADSCINNSVNFIKQEILSEDCHEKELIAKYLEESIQKVVDHEEVINYEVPEDRSTHLAAFDVDVIKSVDQGQDSNPDNETNNSNESQMPELPNSSECLLSDKSIPIDNVIESSKGHETTLISVETTDDIALHVTYKPTTTESNEEIFREADQRTLPSETPSENQSLEVNCCDSIVLEPPKENTTIASMNGSEKQTDKSIAKENKIVPTDNNEVMEISDATKQEAEKLPVSKKNETSGPTDSKKCIQISLDSSVEVQREDSLKKDNLIVQNDCSTNVEVEELSADSSVAKVEMADTSDAGKSFNEDLSSDGKETSTSDIAGYSKSDEPKIDENIASVIPVIDEVCLEVAVTNDGSMSIIGQILPVIDKAPPPKMEKDQFGKESLASNSVFSVDEIKAEHSQESSDLANNLQVLCLEEVANTTEKIDDDGKMLEISLPLEDSDMVPVSALKAEGAIQNEIVKEEVDQSRDEVERVSSLLPEEASTNINKENIVIENLSPSIADNSTQEDSKIIELIITESELNSLVPNSTSGENECDKVLNCPDLDSLVEEKVIPSANESTNKAQDNFLLENEEPPDTMVSSESHLISMKHISDAAGQPKERVSHVNALENENVNADQISLELRDNMLKSMEEPCDLLENILPPIDFQMNDEKRSDEDTGISSQDGALACVLTETSLAPEVIPISTVECKVVPLDGADNTVDEMASPEILLVAAENLEREEDENKNSATFTDGNICASPEKSATAEIISSGAAAPSAAAPIEMLASAEISASDVMSSPSQILSPSSEPQLSSAVSDYLSISTDPKTAEIFIQESILAESVPAKSESSSAFEECVLNFEEIATAPQESQKVSPKTSPDVIEKELVLEKPMTETEKSSIAPENYRPTITENKSTLAGLKPVSSELPQTSGDLIKSTAESSFVSTESVPTSGEKLTSLEKSIQAVEEPEIVTVSEEQMCIAAEKLIDHSELAPGSAPSATLTAKSELDFIAIASDLIEKVAFVEETRIDSAENVTDTATTASESADSAKPDPFMVEPTRPEDVLLVSKEFSAIVPTSSQSPLESTSAIDTNIEVTEEQTSISNELASGMEDSQSAEMVSATSTVETETLPIDITDAQTGYVSKDALISDELSVVSAQFSLIHGGITSTAKRPGLFIKKSDFKSIKAVTFHEENLSGSAEPAATPTNNEINSNQCLSVDSKTAKTTVKSASVPVKMIDCIAQQDFLLVRSKSATSIAEQDFLLIRSKSAPKEQSKVCVKSPISAEYKDSSADITSVIADNARLAERNQVELAKLTSTDEPKTHVSAASSADSELASTESVLVAAESIPATIEPISKSEEMLRVSENSSSVTAELDIPASETQSYAKTEHPYTKDASVLTKPSSMDETISIVLMESALVFTENAETLPECAKDIETTEATVDILSNFAEPILFEAVLVASAESTHIATEYKHIFEDFSRAPVNLRETAEPSTVQPTFSSEKPATDLEISSELIENASLDAVECAPTPLEDVLISQISLPSAAGRELSIEESHTVSEGSASLPMKLEQEMQELTILAAQPGFVLSEPTIETFDSASDETTNIAEPMVAAGIYTLGATQPETVAEKELSATISVPPFEKSMTSHSEIASNVKESILEPSADCENCKSSGAVPADVTCMSDFASPAGDSVRVAEELEPKTIKPTKKSPGTTRLVPQITVDPPDNDEQEIHGVEPEVASEDLTAATLEKKPVLEEPKSEDIYSKPESSPDPLINLAEPPTIPVAPELITTESESTDVEFAATTDPESMVEELKLAVADMESISRESSCSITIEPESFFAGSPSDPDESFAVSARNEPIHNELSSRNSEAELVTAQSVSTQDVSSDVLAESKLTSKKDLSKAEANPICATEIITEIVSTEYETMPPHTINQMEPAVLKTESPSQQCTSLPAGMDCVDPERFLVLEGSIPAAEEYVTIREEQQPICIKTVSVGANVVTYIACLTTRSTKGELEVTPELATDNGQTAVEELREINEDQILPDFDPNEAFETIPADTTAFSDIKNSKSELDVSFTLPADSKLESNIRPPADSSDTALNVPTIEDNLKQAEDNEMEISGKNEIMLDEALAKDKSGASLEKVENIDKVISAIEIIDNLEDSSDLIERTKPIVLNSKGIVNKPGFNIKGNLSEETTESALKLGGIKTVMVEDASFAEPQLKENTDIVSSTGESLSKPLVQSDIASQKQNVNMNVTSGGVTIKTDYEAKDETQVISQIPEYLQSSACRIPTPRDVTANKSVPKCENNVLQTVLVEMRTSETIIDDINVIGAEPSTKINESTIDSMGQCNPDITATQVHDTMKPVDSVKSTAVSSIKHSPDLITEAVENISMVIQQNLALKASSVVNATENFVQKSMDSVEVKSDDYLGIKEVDELNEDFEQTSLSTKCAGDKQQTSEESINSGLEQSDHSNSNEISQKEFVGSESGSEVSASILQKQEFIFAEPAETEKRNVSEPKHFMENDVLGKSEALELKSLDDFGSSSSETLVESSMIPEKSSDVSQNLKELGLTIEQEPTQIPLEPDATLADPVVILAEKARPIMECEEAIEKCTPINLTESSTAFTESPQSATEIMQPISETSPIGQTSITDKSITGLETEGKELENIPQQNMEQPEGMLEHDLLKPDELLEKPLDIENNIMDSVKVADKQVLINTDPDELNAQTNEKNPVSSENVEISTTMITNCEADSQLIFVQSLLVEAIIEKVLEEKLSEAASQGLQETAKISFDEESKNLGSNIDNIVGSKETITAKETDTRLSSNDKQIYCDENTVVESIEKTSPTVIVELIDASKSETTMPLNEYSSTEDISAYETALSSLEPLCCSPLVSLTDFEMNQENDISSDCHDTFSARPEFEILSARELNTDVDLISHTEKTAGSVDDTEHLEERIGKTIFDTHGNTQEVNNLTLETSINAKELNNYVQRQEPPTLGNNLINNQQTEFHEDSNENMKQSFSSHHMPVEPSEAQSTLAKHEPNTEDLSWSHEDVIIISAAPETVLEETLSAAMEFEVRAQSVTNATFVPETLKLLEKPSPTPADKTPVSAEFNNFLQNSSLPSEESDVISLGLLLISNKPDTTSPASSSILHEVLENSSRHTPVFAESEPIVGRPPADNTETTSAVADLKPFPDEHALESAELESAFVGNPPIDQQLTEAKQETEQQSILTTSKENTTMRNFAEGCEDSLSAVNERSTTNSISTSPFKFNADAIIEELIQQIDYSTSPLYQIEDADYSIFDNPDYEPISSLPWHCLVDEIQDINEIESDPTTENSEPEPEPELSITPPEIAMCYMTTTILEPIPEDVELLETQPPNTPSELIPLDDNSSLKTECHDETTPDESSSICVTTAKTQDFEKLKTNPENESNLNTTQQEDKPLSSHSLKTTDTISECDHIQNTDTECTSAESSTLPTDKQTSTESSSTTTTTTSVETVRTAIEIPLDGQKTRASALHERESHKDSKISHTTSPLKKPFSVSIAFEVKDAPTNTTNLPEQTEQAVTQTETRDSNGLLSEIPPQNSSITQDTVISNDDTANPGDRHYTKVKLLKNTAFSRRLSDDEDDVQVGHLHNLLPGSIAEREHKKWYNAVEMPNNPYSKEALKRRLSTTSEKPIDIPNINSPLEKATSEDQVNRGEDEHDIANDTKHVEYRRYGRDYYINDAKYASGSSRQSKLTQSISLHGLNVDADQSSVKEQTLQSQQQLSSSLSSLTRSHSWGDKHSKIVPGVGGNGSVNVGGGSRSSSCDIFTARPVRVEESDPILSKATKLEYLSTAERDFYLLPTEEISGLRSISASEHSLSQAGDSLTPSEDSDTIRVYDLKTQQTRLIREDDSVSSVPAVKELIDTNTTRAHRQQQRGQSPANLRPHLLTQRSLHPTSSVNRGSTPTAFRFLQPKRKLYDSRRVMSEDMAAVYDRENLSRSNGTPEKSVIEEDVIPALPSVKALTKVFQNTSQDGGVQLNRPKSYSWKSVDIKSKEDLTPATQEATPTTAQSPTPIYEEPKSEPEPSSNAYPPSYDQKYIPAENPVVPPIFDEQDKHTEPTPVTPVTESESPKLVTFADNTTEETIQPSKAENLIDLTAMSQPVEDIPKEELSSPAEPCKDSYSPPYDQKYIPAEAPVVSPVAIETEEKLAEVKSDESNSLEWKEENVEIIATPKSDEQATPPNTPDAQENESVLSPESETPVVESTSSLLETKEEHTSEFIQTTETRESTIVEKFIENEKRASIPPVNAPAPIQSEATPQNDDIRIIPLKPTESAEESVVNPVAEVDTTTSIEPLSTEVFEEAPVSSPALATAQTTLATEALPTAAVESISVEVTSLSLNHTSTEQLEDETPAVSSPEPPVATTNGLAVDTKPAENGFHEASPASPKQEEQNETSKQTVVEQKRSEIRFTQEQPLQNRPISPVLVPGKLKSSIAFFENLKNKK